MSKQRYLFIDTETTGLDPAINEVIEVAAVIYEQGDDDEFPEEKGRYVCKLRADKGEVDLRALQLNQRRLTEDLVYDSIVTADIQKDIIFGLADFFAQQMTFHTYLVGANITFDIEFLRALFKLYGIDSREFFFGKKIVDVQQVARFLHDGGVIDVPNFKLSTLFKEFDLSWWNREHTAMSDAMATAGVYFKMRDML